MVKMNEKIQKKNSFFSIHNVNLKKSVDNFCSIVKLHFLKTKIQNRIYRDFEHHFLTNFGKIIFLKIPYIWEFYGFFRKKNKKTRILNLLIHCIFNIFLRTKSKNDFFFLLYWYLYILGCQLCNRNFCAKHIECHYQPKEYVPKGYQFPVQTKV